MIEAEELAFHYSSPRLEVFESLSFSVRRDEVAVLLGPSGCGKSTLLGLMAGFMCPTRGILSIGGRTDFAPGQLSSMVFQEDATFPWMTVEQNVGYAAPFRKGGEWSKDDVRRFLELCGLEGFERAWPRTLSGGMRKRVELARALASGLPVLLLDEPFASLDMLTRKRMHGVLKAALAHEPRTVVLVTHDVDEAVATAQVIFVLSSRPGTVTGSYRPEEWEDRESLRNALLQRVLEK